MTFIATAAYPYESLERATQGIRAALRHQILAAGIRGLQVWDTFVVTGPTTAKDARGNTWFEYRATVESSGPFDRATTVPPLDYVPRQSA